jgi:ABC-type transporter Mla MlaB component
MAKDENGGLLSKVVRFVRNPATSWSDLDHEEQDREGDQSKQALKEIMERKKNNDFVRKREFDVLRKLRRREISAPKGDAVQPSFFPTSGLPSKEGERALTIKKIDEIEAQMSMQWWKSKSRGSAAAAPFRAADTQPMDTRPATWPPTMPHQAAPVGAAPVTPTASRPTAPPSMAASARPVAVAPVSPSAAPPAPKSAPSVGSAPLPVSPLPSASVAAIVPARPRSVVDAPHSLGHNFSANGFGSSNFMGIEVGEIAHDPELEEASIRFANGDDAGAEAGLREALGVGGARVNHIETWLALFDLHRATGELGRFEDAAMEFANRFQRSAPQWFSMPSMVEALVAAQPAGTGTQAPHWSAPPALTLKSLDTLTEVLSRSAPPWRLDWARLSLIEPAALPRLTQLLHGWATQSVQIFLTAGARLEHVLTDNAPSNDASVSPDWWLARLALLRVMSRMDDFELVALDYCVTYEVSPPSWEKPRCTCQSVSSDGERGGPVTIISSLADLHSHKDTRDSYSFNSEFRVTNLDSGIQAPPVVELSGVIAGDVTGTLQTLEDKFAGFDLLVLSCSKLIRVDFAAAGTLLNWVSMLHVQGRQVQFTGVHRLIAGFFNVIGISEMARVVVRTD